MAVAAGLTVPDHFGNVDKPRLLSGMWLVGSDERKCHFRCLIDVEGKAQMPRLRTYAGMAPPAARAALQLNRMAARAALDVVVHPAHRQRPHTRSYDLVIGMVANSIPPLDGSPGALREALEALTSLTYLIRKTDLHTEATDVDGTPGLWVRPSTGKAATTTILYLHGGGYVCGSHRTHLGLLAHLAGVTGAQVFGLDYRLAPEAPYPAAVVDAWCGYWWLLDQGVAPESIFLAGDSAGGGLSVALLVALRDAGMPLPAGGLLFSPWVDLAFRGQSILHNASRDYLNERWLRDCASMYLHGAEVTTPLASPVYADLHGLPPLLIQVGTAEMLFDDATRLAQRATAAGTPVELELWENMVHVWQLLDGVEPNAGTAVHRAAHFMRRNAKFRTVDRQAAAE